MQPTNAHGNSLRACMVGMGMIFDETYRPMFESLHAHGLFRKDFGYVNVALASVATRTGARARAYKERAGSRIGYFTSFDGPDGVKRASSVVEVSFQNVVLPERGTFSNLRGEALYVDLGSGARPLVALLTNQIRGYYGWTRDAGPNLEFMCELYDVAPPTNII